MACSKSGGIPLFTRAWGVFPFTWVRCAASRPLLKPAELARLAVQIFAGPTCRMRQHEALADRFFSGCAASSH